MKNEQEKVFKSEEERAASFMQKYLGTTDFESPEFAQFLEDNQMDRAEFDVMIEKLHKKCAKLQIVWKNPTDEE